MCEAFNLNCPSPPLLSHALCEGQSLVRGFSEGYNSALDNHYYATTAAQAFLLVGTGDVLSQLIEGRAEAAPVPYDLERTTRMAVLGLLIGGLGTACWLRHLEGWLPGHESAARVLQKACLDAGFWAPIANTAYLVLVPLLEGKSTDEVKGMLDERFVPVMKTELATFFPYNLISFSMIPPLYRPFTTGFVSCCFAVFISFVTHNQVLPPDDATTDDDEAGGAAPVVVL